MDLNSASAYSARDQTPPPPYDDVLGEAGSDAPPLSEKASHMRKWLRQVLCTDYRIIAADHHRHHAAFLLPMKQKLTAISSLEYPTDFAAKSELSREIIDEELVTPAQELNLSRGVIMPIFKRYIAEGGYWYTGCIRRMDFRDIEDKVQVDLNIIVPAVISPWESELRANLERRIQHVKMIWSQEAARRAKFDPFVDEFGVGIHEPAEQQPEITEHLLDGKMQRLCRDCPELAAPCEGEGQQTTASIEMPADRSEERAERPIAQEAHDYVKQRHERLRSRRAALLAANEQHSEQTDQGQVQLEGYLDKLDSHASGTYPHERTESRAKSQKAPIVADASAAHASATLIAEYRAELDQSRLVLKQIERDLASSALREYSHETEDPRAKSQNAPIVADAFNASAAHASATLIAEYREKLEEYREKLDQGRLKLQQIELDLLSSATRTLPHEKEDLREGSQNAPILADAYAALADASAALADASAALADASTALADAFAAHASATVHVARNEKTARKTSGPLRERKGGSRIQAPPPSSILKSGHTEQSGRRRTWLESYLDKLDSRAHILLSEKTAGKTSDPPHEDQTIPDKRRGIFGRVLSGWNDLREPAQSREGGPPKSILKNGHPHRK